ncbi:MAG TPA: amidase family protein [Actinomycetota bacterium]|nr:amidase family protein [Actinomycetota bacterium]
MEAGREEISDGAEALDPRVNDRSLVTFSAREIARLIAAGEVSALELLQAHVERIEAVNPRLNAVVLPLFEEALARAAEADAARSRGDLLGRLHGVPVTVKESFDVTGTPTTAGATRRVGELASQDSPLVRRLRDAGAIVLGKTNVAQALLYHETDNPLYGLTKNPWDLDRSPGGSSGGEAAIIAAGGSPLGLGSDIGGSIRVPAHFCGIHGLKPTANRLTRRGGFDRRMFPGQSAIVGQAGPLGRSVADLALAMNVLVGDAEPEDASIPPVPLADQARIGAKRLRVGFYTYDGLFPAAPAVRRVVEESGRALAGRGFEVEEYSPPDPEEAFTLYYGLLSAGGVRWVREFVGRGPIDRRVRALLMVAALPRPVRALAVGLARALGQAGLAMVVGSMRERSAAGYWELVERCERYRVGFLATMAEQGIDAILCPPHPLPALTHGATYDLGTGGIYATLYNLLGMPAGMVSLSRVGVDEETDRPPTKDRALEAASNVERGSAGLPVGVQVVAPHWREDIVLALMAALEEEFRNRPDYPVGYENAFGHPGRLNQVGEFG